MFKQRKILSLLMSAVMIVSMFSGLEILSVAEDDILSYLTYEINDGSVTITDCDDSASGKIVIPETIEGYRVTTIGDWAFERCGFTDIILPDSIKEIGAGAFSSCFKLNSVNIPKNVTTLKDFTFSSCYSLKEFVIPDNITDVEMGVFSSCFNLEKVVFPDSIREISTGMFTSCFNLKEIIIPDSVTEIEDYAFVDCWSLESISIPENVESLGFQAFYNIPRLKDIYIYNPDIKLNHDIYFEDQEIDYNSIYNAINVPEGYTLEEYIELYFELIDAQIDTMVNYFDNPEEAEEKYRELAEKYEDIGTCETYEVRTDFTIHGYDVSTAHDFADDNGINFVAVDSAEKTKKSVLKFNVGSSWVGETVGITLSAKNMAGLESADLEFSFDEEYFEFEYVGVSSENLENLGVDWTDYQYDTGKVSFSFCFATEPLTDIELGTLYLVVLKPGISEVSVTCRSWDGAPGMPDDTSIKLGLVKRQVIDEEESTGYDEDFSEPDYADEPEYCFTYAVIDDEVIITDCDDSGAGEIVIPETIEGYPVTMIGENAFKYCTFITDVVLPDSIKEIGASAFSSCFRLKNINIPEAVTTLKEFTFSSCYSLKEFVIPDNITDVEMGVFSNCMGLEKVILPDSITKISEAMFNACFNLKDVIIPDTVTEIGSIAFYQCYSLESIVIPESVEKLGAMAFGDIPNLKDIYIYNPDIELVYEYEGMDFDGIYNVTSVPEGYTLEEYIELYYELIDAQLDVDLNYSDNQEEFEEKYREFKEKYEEIFSREFHDVRTDLTIHGYDVSTAHEFADKNGINFVSFESEEETPDDSQQGNTEDNTCSRCGKVHNNAISELFCAIKSFFEKIIDFIVNLFN